jgi:hypothetical protein
MRDNQDQQKRIVPINSHLKEYYLKLDDTLQTIILFGSFRKVRRRNKVNCRFHASSYT